MKPTFDKSEIKFGVSDNIKFDNIIGPNNENILSTIDKDDMKNAMHSSDSIENVKRESKIVFK